MNWILVLCLLLSFSDKSADDFADKMEDYYGIELQWEIRDLGSWYGATLSIGGSCVNTVYLSDQFYGELGNDDLWKGVLAHEWAHVLQGSKCNNAERLADRVALDMLLKAKEFHAYATYALFLQDRWNWTPEETYYHFYGD